MTDRELDALVAERVMGLERDEKGYWQGELGVDFSQVDFENGLPFYSTTGDGMLAVVEAMRGKGYGGVIYVDRPSAVFIKMPGVTSIADEMLMLVSADSLPRAVCLAALRALKEPRS